MFQGRNICDFWILVVFAVLASPWCRHKAIASSVEFGYDNQCAWEDIPGSQCNGNKQSPINIDTNSLQCGTQKSLQDLVFSYLHENPIGTWTNNGHSLQFTPANNQGMTVRVHGGTYELQQFHFHWGHYDYEGSEHRVNGRQYSGEMHFVHKTTAHDATGNEADYYTVIGVLLQSDSSITASDTIWEAFMNIPNHDEEISISSSFTYTDLLPSNNPDYYYYSGSLTTPPCSEIVQWVLLKQPLSVPCDFFEAVRTANKADGHKLTYNFRHAQVLNGRKVYQHI